MKEATKRQQEVLAFIAGYIRAHSYPPTIRELAEHFSISVKGAHDHIAALKKKGLIKHTDKKSRTMELVHKETRAEEEFQEIPVLGAVAAGKPILCAENLSGYIRLHQSMLGKYSCYFALKVQGDSMTEAGILDGDTAVIEQRDVVNNGDIAVVMLEEAVTIKTFYKENNRVRLQPENQNYAPIYCGNDVKVLGRLAHVIRSYGHSL
jgi:repressor LexA